MYTFVCIHDFDAELIVHENDLYVRCLGILTNAMLLTFEHDYMYTCSVHVSTVYLTFVLFTFLYLCCSVQLSMSYMGKRYRNRIIIIIMMK